MSNIDMQDDENTFLIYRNKQYVGIIEVQILHRRNLYQAFDKYGVYLGKSRVYGEALNLIYKNIQQLKYSGED